jgi:flagellar hook protein FlgE
MSFQQGLSGLNAASSSLDVIGNNIANSSTVGFKSGSANFSDIYAASLGIVSGAKIGIGVGVGAVQQQFTQGNLTTTNNPLDLALNGGGFFRLSDEGAISYTRNGQFHIDNDGYVINDQRSRLTGYPVAASGAITPSNPIELQISAGQIAPRRAATRSLVNCGRCSISTRATRLRPSPIRLQQSGNLQFLDRIDGFRHPRRGAQSDHFLRSQWHDGTRRVDRARHPRWCRSASRATGRQSASSTLRVRSTRARRSARSAVVEPDHRCRIAVVAGGHGFHRHTQYGSGSNVDRLTQGGFTSGSLVGVGVNADGIVQGRYSNGQTRNMGQVVLATFADPNGLLSLGNNQWSLTSLSGPELIGAPASGSRGVIQSAAVEDSNVDLTKELVDMITAQRNYQANAQTIKTQDQIMQTLVNLR